MALLSPGIQIFESSTTPATATVPAENGVATLGFSKKGPVDKLTRIRSVSEFAEVFGDPISDNYYSHILAQSVLSNGTDVYFMRIGDKNTLANAQCPVVSDFDITGAKVAITGDANFPGYLTAQWSHEGSSVTSPSAQLFEIRIGTSNSDVNLKTIDVEANFAAKWGEGINILYVSLLDVYEALVKEAGDLYNFTIVNNSTENGILVSAKNEQEFKEADVTLKIAASWGNKAGSVWHFTSEASCSSGNLTDLYSEAQQIESETVTDFPTATDSGEFGGASLSPNSSLKYYTDIASHDRFNLVAKYPGSDMNGVRVVKSTVTSSIGGAETWTVSVYDKDAQQPMESRTGITPDNFLEEMTKFAYIGIDDAELGTGGETWEWVDGTWELGVGRILSNGDNWVPDSDDYKVVEGDDGYPTDNIDGKKQYSETRAANLYVEALGNDDFINTDEYSFSILATPGIQTTLVQNAAINVCTTRGDAIYLADVPSQYCEDKQGIDEAVAWANGNSAFQSSYCAIYYGWFYQTNPYATDNSISCPASCFIASKMVSLDQSMGEFFAPAGIARGGIICSDWTYSPDQKDRDKLVGGDNVINPISYSNTRGVTIMAQKTTDRTTSPLNRVGVRRMTNAIKRNLRSMLVALLFEPNNETSRARARMIVDNIMASLRARECIESYDINVTSGTGANRNDLNVYLSFAPYGLIEKIYVYINITDAGIEVTEAVA